jgi:hypothetical protein
VTAWAHTTVCDHPQFLAFIAFVFYAEALYFLLI